MSASHFTCPDCGSVSSNGATYCAFCEEALRAAPSVPPAQPGAGSTQFDSSNMYHSGGVQYDPAVIRGYATNLYHRASMIVGLYTLGGAAGGFATLGIMGTFLNGSGYEWIIGAVAGGGFGYLNGSMLANRLRLEAQVAMCQVEIEQNTCR